MRIVNQTAALCMLLVPAASAQTVPTAQAESEGIAGIEVAGWTTGGVGAASLLAGIVVFAVGVSEESDLIDKVDDKMGDVVVGITQVDAQRQQEDAESLQTVGAATMIAGGVVLAAGIAMLLLAPDGADVPRDGGREKWDEYQTSLLPIVGSDSRSGYAGFRLRF